MTWENTTVKWNFTWVKRFNYSFGYFLYKRWVPKVFWNSQKDHACIELQSIPEKCNSYKALSQITKSKESGPKDWNESQYLLEGVTCPKLSFRKNLQLKTHFWCLSHIVKWKCWWYWKEVKQSRALSLPVKTTQMHCSIGLLTAQQRLWKVTQRWRFCLFFWCDQNYNKSNARHLWCRDCTVYLHTFRGNCQHNQN